MKLTRTRRLLPRVEWLDETDSTNAALRGLCEREPDATPHGTLVATANQVSGRGRLGRGWVTPPGLALAASVLVRTGVDGVAADRVEDFDEDHRPLPLSWLPLLAGSAVAAILQPLFCAEDAGDPPADADSAAPKRVGIDGAAPMRVGVKWPNDVHVRDEFDAQEGGPGKKLCGILSEVVSLDASRHSPAVIIGMGINLLIPAEALPTERATSVLAAGGDVGGAESLDDPDGQDLADRVLAGVAGELLRLCEQARSDPRAVRTRVLRHSLTLGAEVRVHLPGGELVDGRAVGLADDGSLIVDRPTSGQLIVSAADVEHLR